MCDTDKALKGRVAVVTGAARGIGRAIVERLAQEGADIAACDLEIPWLDEVAQVVRDMGRRVECFAVDVSKSDSVNDGVAKVHAAFGKIDILVNNAGITKDTLMMRMTDEMWDAVLDVNLKGTFLMTRAVSRHMMKQRSGAIVNIASIIGLIGNAGQCNYAASKGGVIALTKSVARELASRNVRSNAVAPGFIQTRMTDQLPDDVKAKMLEAIPMQKLGTVDDVANCVLFLASDASSYLTGQVISVNGGMMM